MLNKYKNYSYCNKVLYLLHLCAIMTIQFKKLASIISDSLFFVLV